MTGMTPEEIEERRTMLKRAYNAASIILKEDTTEEGALSSRANSGQSGWQATQAVAQAATALGTLITAEAALANEERENAREAAEKEMANFKGKRPNVLGA